MRYLLILTSLVLSAWPASASPIQIVFVLNPAGSVSFSGGIGTDPVFTGLNVAGVTSSPGGVSSSCIPYCDVTINLGALTSYSSIAGGFGTLDEWNFNPGTFTVAANGGEYLQDPQDPSNASDDLTGTLLTGNIGATTLVDLNGSFEFEPPGPISNPTFQAGLVGDFEFNPPGPDIGQLQVEFTGTESGPACPGATCGAFASASALSDSQIAITGTPEPASVFLVAFAFLGLRFYAGSRRQD